MKLENLYKKHRGHDIYILGSGASLDFIHESFFDNKIVIACNKAYRIYPKSKYVITHHHDFINSLGKDYIALAKNYELVVSRFDCCVLNRVLLPEKTQNTLERIAYIYDAPNQKYRDIDFITISSSISLFTGGTIIVDAISLAHYMGAKNIILCGVDGGSLNGNVNCKNYYQNAAMPNQKNHAVITSQDIVKTRNELAKHGVNIYSLNPFVNMDFEGNKFCKNL